MPMVRGVWGISRGRASEASWARGSGLRHPGRVAAVAATALVTSGLLTGTLTAAAGARPLPSSTSTTSSTASTGLSTVAGSFCTGPSATSTAVSPTGVVWDGQGGFYLSVADRVHAEVCHVDSVGRISVAAGDGSPGYMPAPLGDQVSATGAELYAPTGLALGGGNLYIADSWNGRVRQVDSSGIITSMASGMSRPTSVVPDGKGGLYVADQLANKVFDLSASGQLSVFAGTGTAGHSGDGGPATSAEMYRPFAVVTLSSGAVLISDSGNNVIREVDPYGTIHTFAGTGTAGYTGDGGPAARATLNGPGGLATDSASDVYIADSNNAVVREIDSSSGQITTVAGSGVSGSSGDGGPATAARLTWPTGVSVEGSGRLLIADNGASRVREVASGIISTVAGNGTMGLSGDGGAAVSASLSEPLGVALGPGGIYVADSWDTAVRLIGSTGTISTLAGAGSGLSFPVSLTVDAKGDVYVADYGNRVFEIAGGTNQVRVVAGTGVSGYSGDGGPATSATLSLPAGLALDKSGDLFIADSGNNVIREVTSAGIIKTVAGNGYPTSTTNPLGDGGRAVTASLNNPQGIYLGSQGLYIADRNNQRIRLVSNKGIISTVAGDGQVGWTGNGTPASSSAFNYPSGVGIDADGNVLVADNGNCVIRSIDLTTRTVNTVAGWSPARGVYPTCGYVGSDGTQMLNHPTAVATSGNGTVYVADSLNNRVRSFVP